jgi:hypothetical protein
MSKKVDDIPAPVLDFLASDNGSQFSQWIFQALDARSEVLLKPPPHFSGSSFEDPKVFIVNFDKAAKANRWIMFLVVWIYYPLVSLVWLKNGFKI